MRGVSGVTTRPSAPCFTCDVSFTSIRASMSFEPVQTRPVPHVAARELAAMIPAAQCALLVIDVQEDFASPAGAMARAGADLSGVPAVLANIRALIGAARAAGA